MLSRAQLLTALVCQKAQTDTSFEMLPIQLNLVASKAVPFAWPSSGSNTIPRANVPMNVPSLRAAL